MESADITNRAVQRSSIQQVVYLNYWNWDAGVMNVQLWVPMVSNNKTYKNSKLLTRALVVSQNQEEGI